MPVLRGKDAEIAIVTKCERCKRELRWPLMPRGYMPLGAEMFVHGDPDCETAPLLVMSDTGYEHYHHYDVKMCGVCVLGDRPWSWQYLRNRLRTADGCLWQQQALPKDPKKWRAWITSIRGRNRREVLKKHVGYELVHAWRNG